MQKKQYSVDVNASADKAQDIMLGITDKNTYEQWTAEGGLWQHDRATARVKQILRDYEAPEMDISILEALDDFTARRTFEITGERA